MSDAVSFLKRELFKHAYEGNAQALKAAIEAVEKIPSVNDTDDKKKVESPIEAVDKHGYTPLLLAIKQGNRGCVETLLEKGAKTLNKGTFVWTPLDEAVSRGDKDIVLLLLTKLNKKDHAEELRGKTQDLFKALADMEDCYLEIEWDVHSWVPLVSRALPSDKIKVWKKGNKLRFDSTLLNVTEQSLKRGARSYVLSTKIVDNEPRLDMITIDHTDKTWAHESLFKIPNDLKKGTEEEKLEALEDHANMVMRGDVMLVDATTSKAKFPRAMSGWLGWKSEKSETVHDTECRVYDVEELELITRRRREHLSEEDIKSNKKFQNDMMRGKIPEDFKHPTRTSLPPPTTPSLTFEEYNSLDLVQIGRPLDENVKSKALKGTLWMCDDFPIQLKTIVNVFKVLAPTSDKFEKVHAFLDNQLPKGFPRKVEVPVFPTVSVRVSVVDCEMGNIKDSTFDVPDDVEEITVEEMEGSSRMEDEVDDEGNPIAILDVDEEGNIVDEEGNVVAVIDSGDKSVS
eukprot:m.35206 g.35206  ORF g.35206 m.35206 type:complete len:513 (-) comp17101_c1_seq1:285-1823(-)